MLRDINQIDPKLIPAIEDRIKAKLRALPENLIPELLRQLGDPPDPENIHNDFVTEITMTIQDKIRQVVDKRFENEIQRISNKQQRELEFLLGSKPNIDQVPESWWQQSQRDMENAVVLFLVSAYGLSAKWHGMPLKIADDEALKYASTKAKNVAQGWVVNTKKQVLAAQKRWSQAAVILASGSSTTRQIKQAKHALTKTGIRNQLKQIFSRDRSKTLAVSEVTSAISQAGEKTKQQSGNIESKDLWWTKEDDRVCPVCKPLHGKPRSVWAEDFPLGPPAHKRCRCRIQYAS